MRLFVATMLLSNAAVAAAFEISLAVDNISHPALAAERVRAQATDAGTLLTIERMRLGGRGLRNVRLSCREFEWSGADLRCRGGGLKVGAGDTANLDFSFNRQRGVVDIVLRDTAVAGLAAVLPELAAWQGKGKLSGTMRLSGAVAEGELVLVGGAFANAAGTQAGEGIAVRVSGRAQQDGGAWRWQARATWQGGEVYVAPWYFKGEGQALSARGVLDAATVRVEDARLTLPRVGLLDVQANWDRDRKTFTTLKLATDTWQAAEAWARYGQPQLGETPRVRPQGTVRLALAFDATGLASADLAVVLDRIDVADGRYAFKDLQARVPWRRNALTQAHIVSGGGRAGDLSFGAFTVPLNMEGLRFRFDQVAVPLLDGRLLFEDFAMRQLDTGWNWRLAAALEPVSLPLLTRALGLPTMAGTLAANMPRMRYRNHTLSLDGSLVVSVFDGYLAVDGLNIVEPFGRAPRTLADVSARHLDLAQLTQTFSFGNITGFIDAELRGLEMAGWQPAAFDARVVTSAGDFDKRISRRAVRNISALGGGASAGAAVEASVVGFFDTFGYERLGLSCRLLAGVCLMGGLADSERGYLIVQGGGLPSLNVMGYNRRVGWDVFVSRLRDVAAGNSKAIIE